MAEIDSLEIKITSEAGNAKKSIDDLSRSLGTLSKKLKFDTSDLEKLGNVNGTNFKNLGVGVKTLSSGLKDLQGIKKSDFNRLAAGIERLSTIQPGNMEAVGNALKPLAQGINVLSNAKFDNKNLTNLINSITRLSNANTGSLANIDFAALGNSIKGLSDTLAGAKKVEQNTISMTNAVAKLANAGAGAGAVATALPELGKKLKEFMQTMHGAQKVSEETISFTQALGTLASAGSRAAATANNLDALKDKVLSFIDSLSRAPNVSAGVVQLLKSLALLANAGNRANNSMNSFWGSGSRASSSTRVLKSSIDGLSKSMNGLKGSIRGAFGGVKNFTRQVLAANGIILGIYGAVSGIKKSLSTSSALTEVQNVVDVTLGDMAYKVEDFAKNSIKQFGMSELSVKQYASRFQAMGTAMGISSASIGKANEFLNKQSEGYVGLSDSMSDVSINLTKLTADMASLYDMEQKSVAEDLEAIFTGQTRPLRTYGLDLTQATLAEWAMKQGLDADIKSMSQAEKTMLRYQYVIANTTAAHGDFERTMYTWANQTRILKQNFEQLASIIGGALVNAFKPVVIGINKAMGSIVSFAKTISNALGQIFGWTYEEGGGGLAQDFGAAADGAGDLEDSTGKIAKNMEEAQKGARVFDELKIINLPEAADGKGGGSGNGSGAGAGESAIGKWNPGESIINKFTSEIDSLYKLGEYIGDTLKDTLDGIDWESVYASARNFGTGLAEFLNGLISPGLFSTLGTTVAKSINTALHALDSFGETFKWENFGKSLASGLVSFLQGIDWGTALSAASNWGKGIGTALNNFITPETFKEVGNAIAMALNTAVQFALSLGTTLDFYQFGQSVAIGISEFFATFDFASLAQTLNVWVDNLWDFIKGIIDGISWGDIWKGVKDFFSNLDLDTAVVLSIAVAPLAIAGFTEFIGILSNIWGIVGKVQVAFQILSIVLGSITAPIALVVSAIATLVAGLGYVFSTNEDVRKSFSESVDAITKNLNPALELITKTVLPDLKKGWNGLKGILKPFGDFLKDVFTSIWQDMINPALKYIGDKVLPILVSTFENLWKNVLVPFGTFLGDVLKPIIKTISDVLSVLWKNVVVPLANAIGKTLGKAFEAICGILNKTVIPIVNSVIKVFQFLWNDVFSPIVRFLKKTLGPVFSGVFETIGEIIEGLSDTFGGLIDFITGVFSGDWEKAWEGIKDVFEGIWKTLLSPIKLVVNGIIKGINWVLKAVGAKELDPWEPDGFATGSNGLPRDTIGIVNDQKGSTYKELIVPPHGKPFIPEGRNVMLSMEKGTKIMPARQTKGFMENFKDFPHFARGIGDFFKGAWSRITEFTGNVWDYLSNPVKLLQIAFDKFTDLSGMFEPMLSIATGAASKILDGATGFIKKMFDENLTVQYNPSKGVEQWRGLATKALQITNQFTDSNLTALLSQMQHESSGNPKAINLWDANARKGTPSKGLMQVIDPTFRAYSLPPHNKDIWDPLSNMIAAIRYTVSHYGSLYSGWTARGYRGYASGIGKINIADLIPKYRAGGFPEDGLFYANHTEVVGRFSNGKTAAANNDDIAKGFAEAIYPAMYNAVSAAMKNNAGSQEVTFHVEGDPNGIFRVVKKEWRDESRRLRKNPVTIYT